MCSADEAAREALQLPDLTLFEVGNTPPNGFTVAERITVITLAEVQSKLAAEASGAKVPGTLQVAEFQNSILQRTRSMNHIFWGMNGERPTADAAQYPWQHSAPGFINFP